MTDANLTPGWATYLRVSDEDKQSPERSFLMQRQAISENLLESSDLPFIREYRDILSGKTPCRAQYQQMLSDAEHGGYSHLGLYRADRFGRDSLEGHLAAKQLMANGIKIRVASDPSMRPETPDGEFFFVMKMGMAQREVDVLSQRVSDGKRAKLLRGGWPHRAPEGYVNKEKLIKSGKYERWVEKDPNVAPALREAWDMLLTGRYTLDQICEELTALGYTRSGARPWAWTDAKTGKRRNAKNRLHYIFHNPFYAGWVVSKGHGVAYGEVRSQWEPIVTIEEFDRGIMILRKHDKNKLRTRRHFYLLRNMLWTVVDGTSYKMYVSTPTGRSRSYAYYETHAKPNGKSIHIQCDVVDSQIPNWLQGVAVEPRLVPAIRELYASEIGGIGRIDRDAAIEELHRRLMQLRTEEARIARLYAIDQLTIENYNQLRAEWQEKVRHAEANLADLEGNVAQQLDDLDTALVLVAHAHRLYSRLAKEARSTLLQILAKRIIVNADGEIIDHELHSPFTYLTGLVEDLRTAAPGGRGSETVRLPLYKRF